MSIFVKYSFFAAIAIVLNLASQHLFILVYQGPFDVWASMFFGTGVGLVVKYWLDKHYIFAFESKNLSHDSQVFFLYTVMGILTTAIFWGVEMTFDYLSNGSNAMRYLGGAIGLTVGYVIKYALDKRFVFVSNQ